MSYQSPARNPETPRLAVDVLGFAKVLFRDGKRWAHSSVGDTDREACPSRCVMVWSGSAIVPSSEQQPAAAGRSSGTALPGGPHVWGPPMLASRSDDYVDIHVVGAQLRASRKTVYRLVAARTLPQPFYLSPGRMLWLRSEIDGYVARRIAERAARAA